MNNFKPLFGFIIALMFVFLGIYLVNKSSHSEQSTLILILGIACIVFFGGILIAALVKLVKK
jgi:drug/metabolite transporter (DMT)-like permease